MTRTVEEVLRSFQALAQADKRRVLLELLRWSASEPLTDEDLVAAADEIFQGYDREERERE